jgi:glutamyl-Q tRNA(Asp) synthetase
MEAEPHAWRLDVTKAMQVAGPLAWVEGDQPIAAQPELFGDVVLARKDAPTSYHLAVTVDDADQGVTTWSGGSTCSLPPTCTGCCRRLLDLPTPLYHHHPLLLGPDGQRLAKRSGAPTIASLREAGADPAELTERLRTGGLPYGYSASVS